MLLLLFLFLCVAAAAAAAVRACSEALLSKQALHL
jgi:hypothetical protein